MAIDNLNKKASGIESVEDPNSKYLFPLKKINFIIMGISALLIVLGFVMISGGAPKGDEFNPEVFSAMRIVVGPTVALAGFVGIGVGIMWSGTRTKNEDKA